MVKNLEAIRLKGRGILSLKKNGSKGSVGDSVFVQICHSAAVELYIHILPLPYDDWNIFACLWLLPQSCDTNWPNGECESPAGYVSDLKSICVVGFASSDLIMDQRTCPVVNAPLAWTTEWACLSRPGPSLQWQAKPSCTSSRTVQLSPGSLDQPKQSSSRPVSMRINLCC